MEVMIDNSKLKGVNELKKVKELSLKLKIVKIGQFCAKLRAFENAFLLILRDFHLHVTLRKTGRF